MAGRAAGDSRSQVEQAAVARARAQRDGPPAGDRRKRLLRRLLLTGIGALLAFGFHASPYRATTPVCDGQRMHRGDVCMVISHHGSASQSGSGSYDYDQMQARARHAHHEGTVAMTVLNDVGLALLSLGGLGLLVLAAGTWRGRRPWGTAVDGVCPRCGRARLRERRVGVVLPGEREARARTVTLCTAECDYAGTRPVPAP